MKQSLKFAHWISAIGFAGGLAAYMMVLHYAPEISTTADYHALRAALAMLAKWMIVPSMVIVVCSGLLAMAFHFPFHEARWVWVKAATGLLIFESTLMSIDAPAKRAADATARAANGEIDAATLASLVHDEWGAMWIILALAVANVLLGTWRPRFRRTPVTTTEQTQPD